MGQVPSVQDKRDRKREESKDIQDIRKEIHRIRRKIGEYEELGKDTSALTDKIKTLKKQANMCESSTLNEEGEGGATSCGNVMQGGGSNPDAGQYVTPFGYDKETKKRSKDFKNGSMAIQTEKTDVLSRPIYKL